VSGKAKQVYYRHFAGRLAERYGLIATDRLYGDIIRQIQNTSQVTRVKKINRQRSIHCVYVEGRRVYVLYRKSKVALITALPPLDKYRLMHEEQKARHLIMATEARE
jgi:hypothetical protein